MEGRQKQNQELAGRGSFVFSPKLMSSPLLLQMYGYLIWASPPALYLAIITEVVAYLNSLASTYCQYSSMIRVIDNASGITRNVYGSLSPIALLVRVHVVSVWSPTMVSSRIMLKIVSNQACS